MKSGAVLSLAFVLASMLPAAAQSREETVQAAATTAEWRMAQATTSTAPAQPSTDAGPTAPKKSKTATAPKPRHKKVTSDEPARRSGAAIVKEGGKTCSGLDQYRVCW
jgi:hypothetical protein